MAKIGSELLKRWKERCKLIHETTFEFVDKVKKEVRTTRARIDYAYFVDTYFKHLAKSECGKFQIDAANKIKKNKNLTALFEWARGHAKSTHMSLLIPIWLLIQKERNINVMLLVSKSEESAKRLLGDLQAELENNRNLISDFGDFKGLGNWTDGEFTTKNDVMFIALGRGQSPRGIKNRGCRPDYIVIDDIDDDEITHNKARVDKALQWVLTALAGTMAMGRGRFIMVGNRISKNSILTRFADRPAIHHTVVNAIDVKGRPSWYQNYTLDEIANFRTLMGERNFQQEYMNNPIVEGTIFQERHIRYAKILPLKKYRTLICYTDPSFKNSSHNDFKATMLVGKTAKGEYHIIQAYADQTSVKNMVEWHYQIKQYVNGEVPVMYYMEANFIQDILLDEFRKEGEMRGEHIAIRGDMRRKPDKFARIEAISPYFERGLVILNELERNSIGMINLVEQLLMFERGSKVHDDAPDALEGAIHLLNKRTTTGVASYTSGQRQNLKY
ncbi:MAG: phage terminase large subunit [Rikenellaceae bacterium]